MNRRNKLGMALIGLALILFALPAVFPVDGVLVHDARGSTELNGTQLEQVGATVIGYENLSERGQELYVKTLRNGGEYRVPKGEGAPEFNYTTAAEFERVRESGTPFQTGVFIDRSGAEDLPPAEGGEAVEGRQGEQLRRNVTYDYMITRMGQPKLGTPAQLLRLLSVLVAVVCLGTGGYFVSTKE